MLPLFTYGYTPQHPPMIERMTPQPLKEVETFSIGDGIVTSAENVWRRRLIYVGQEVSLMNGRDGIIESLKPAQGELLRRPTKFLVVVWNEETKTRREMILKSWTPLKCR